MEELKFKKLSEVEVVEEPTEESHVLIVEDGEVKKAPKTAVGGAGGGGYIMKPADDEISLLGTSITVTANADEMLKVLEKGGSAWLRFPTKLLNENLATLLPYSYLPILGMGYFPAGVMAETNTLIAHTPVVIAGECTNYLTGFTNVTYEPFKE